MVAQTWFRQGTVESASLWASLDEDFQDRAQTQVRRIYSNYLLNQTSPVIVLKITAKSREQVFDQLQGLLYFLTLEPNIALAGASQMMLMVKNHLPMQETWEMRFHPWVRKIPWRRAWQPTQVFLPGESQGQRSLVGCSPCGHKVGHDCSNLPCMHGLLQQIWGNMTSCCMSYT